jgi:hypothetical protein
MQMDASAQLIKWLRRMLVRQQFPLQLHHRLFFPAALRRFHWLRVEELIPGQMEQRLLELQVFWR